MFKGAWQTRLAPDEADQAIEETLSWFAERKAPFLFWWTEHKALPVDLADRLAAHGLLSMEGQQHALAPGIKVSAAGSPAMYADLRTMNDAVLDRTPRNFIVRPVESDDDLLEFKRVFVSSYEIPEWAGQAWVDATRHAGIDRAPWRMFIGELDGRAVATNMLYLGAGVAGVYAVATVPEARGRGFGAAVTLRPLLDVKDAGVDHAVLFSSEMGVNVYRQIGFTLGKTRLDRYMWRNPAI
jgi:GNAT superfamily N-acetyltransferase